MFSRLLLFIRSIVPVCGRWKTDLCPWIFRVPEAYLCITVSPSVRLRLRPLTHLLVRVRAGKGLEVWLRRKYQGIHQVRNMDEVRTLAIPANGLGSSWRFFVPAAPCAGPPDRLK